MKDLWSLAEGRYATHSLSAVLGLLLACPQALAQEQALITPSQAVEVALKNNRLVRIASLGVEKNLRAVSVAKTRFLPVISLAADEGRLLSPLTLRIPQGALGSVPGLGAFPVQDTDIRTEPKWTTITTFTIAQPITQIPRIRLGVRLSQEQAALSGEELRQKRQEIADTVRGACYDLAQAQAAKQAADAAATYAAEAAHAAHEGVTHGVLLDQVALDADAKRLGAVQIATTYGNAVDSARMKLNELLARDLFAPLEVDLEAEPQLALPSREDARNLAQSLRPEVKQAEHKLKMAKLAFSLREREDDPDVSLALTYARPYSIDVLPKPVVLMGFHFSWAPVDWGRKRSELGERHSDLQAAELAVQETKSLVALDADVRYRALEERRAEVASAASARVAADERKRVLHEKAKVDAVVLKDVLEADYQASQAEATLVAANCRLHIAESALLKALGRD